MTKFYALYKFRIFCLVKSLRGGGESYIAKMSLYSLWTAPSSVIYSIACGINLDNGQLFMVRMSLIPNRNNCIQRKSSGCHSENIRKPLAETNKSICPANKGFAFVLVCKEPPRMENTQNSNQASEANSRCPSVGRAAFPPNLGKAKTTDDVQRPPAHHKRVYP